MRGLGDAMRGERVRSATINEGAHSIAVQEPGEDGELRRARGAGVDRGGEEGRIGGEDG